MPNPFPNADYPTAYDEDDFLKSGAAPVNAGGVGTDEIQSVFNDATGGDFTLTFEDQETDDIPYDVADDAAVAAAVVLTISDIPVEDNTVTIGGRVYTFKDATTTEADEVHIGVSETEAKANLVAAMDLSGVAGTDYGSETTANTDVAMAAFDGDTADVTALLAGLDGNDIASIATLAGGDFAAATLLLGLDSVESALQALSNVEDVTVTGLGTEASPWLITFVDPGDEDVVLLVADDTGLTGETDGTSIANVVAGSEPLVISDVASGLGPL